LINGGRAPFKSCKIVVIELSFFVGFLFVELVCCWSSVCVEDFNEVLGPLLGKRSVENVDKDGKFETLFVAVDFELLLLLVVED
jgi:hypothetical protein